MINVLTLLLILGLFGFTCYFIGRLTMALDIKYTAKMRNAPKAKHSTK